MDAVTRNSFYSLVFPDVTYASRKLRLAMNTDDLVPDVIDPEIYQTMWVHSGILLR